MSFHHEKLIVYQRALEFAGWSQVLIDSLAKKTFDRLGCRIAEDTLPCGERTELEEEETEEEDN